jgi:uncharacterized membrane protein YkvA (DUF1232 family)
MPTTALANAELNRLLAAARTRKFVNVSIETICNIACNCELKPDLEHFKLTLWFFRTRACVCKFRPHIGGLAGHILENPVRKLLLMFWRTSRVDLRLLWFALRHDARPGWLLPASAGLLLYALAPFNLVIPVLGAVDELVLVPLALHYLVKLLPVSITHGFANSARPGARRRAI